MTKETLSDKIDQFILDDRPELLNVKDVKEFIKKSNEDLYRTFKRIKKGVCQTFNYSSRKVHFLDELSAEIGNFSKRFKKRAGKDLI